MEAFGKNTQDLFEVLALWHGEKEDVNVFDIDVLEENDL